jgi:hypothetical protein
VLGGTGLLAYPLVTDLYTDQVVQGRLADEKTASTPPTGRSAMRARRSPVS